MDISANRKPQKNSPEEFSRSASNRQLTYQILRSHATESIAIGPPESTANQTLKPIKSPSKSPQKPLVPTVWIAESKTRATLVDVLT
jgi:hypothetical protein